MVLEVVNSQQITDSPILGKAEICKHSVVADLGVGPHWLIHDWLAHRDLEQSRL